MMPIRCLYSFPLIINKTVGVLVAVGLGEWTVPMVYVGGNNDEGAIETDGVEDTVGIVVGVLVAVDPGNVVGLDDMVGKNVGLNKTLLT